MKRCKATRMCAGVFACLILAAALAGCGRAYAFAGTPFTPVLDVPAVTGIIRNGQPFALRELPEKVKLIFFGYTSCPDICPLTLNNLKAVYAQLPEEQRSDVGVVLISVDPARDTPARLAAYTETFNPAFYGVQVPEERLVQLLDEFNVFAGQRNLASESDSGGYLVDHTAVIFVVDSKNQLREIFPSDAPADQIAADVRYLLGE